ncbi:MAG: hypothetical protein EON58_18090 [Alphaproteobacteria bacterium]|nr:MAG: hypothetical protein EON58_18090 [Alphaproteobacteria bacterium]
MSSGRPVAIIDLTPEERIKLEELARRRKTSRAMALRSRIILDCAGGLTGGEALCGHANRCKPLTRASNYP